MKAKFIVCLCTLLIMTGYTIVPGGSRNAEAAAFALFEWSARGNAMGGTMIARADDPSAIAWNPAGITQLEGTQTMVGVSAIAPENTLTTTYNGVQTDTDIKKEIFYTPHAFITQQINENLWLGVGAYTRYGLGTAYDEDWEGRYSSYNTSIETYSLNPNLAYKFNDFVSVAAGMEFMYVKADLRKKIDSTRQNDPTTSAGDVDQTIKVDGVTPGFNVGIRITPTDKWALGFSWRSKMRHRAEGKAVYDRPDGVTTALYNDTDVSMTMKTPNMFMFGTSYDLMDNLSVEFDAIWSQWSDYSDLTYEFDSTNAIGRNTVVVQKNWQDVWRFQFGVEYKPIESLALQAGYVYDQSPIRKGYEDYMLPTNDRQIVSGGLGWTYENFSIDASYMYLWMKKRTIDARPTSGVLYTTTKDSITHIVSLSMGFNF
ncbi:OmpP1/FadL family transporter [Maridesulfovibrio sp.]|uniref:OmpP1/FadL family transporter n=1 Tax=Maridesulfovibrio sp. TaxID=2795000 RepID=UPI002A18C7EF|nr:OmpP1/FadL family transporter [Maridesulfovibrio sp.]